MGAAHARAATAMRYFGEAWKRPVSVCIECQDRDAMPGRLLCAGCAVDKLENDTRRDAKLKKRHLLADVFPIG